ncbi:tail assembly protein [Pseudomonas lundensis]|uniref:Phage tail protein n=1 Tax=Pseudomonas lundensis TaxID=86185 RepID=A0AAX2H8Y2_9PSED|nr:tail assembly protein [Pseudomonas lundensis]NNA18893.1 tail assembly protein [Pseudomonas lundensis]SOB53047.1 conserved hypothetical protein [Pseudomonas lundensis]
MKRTVRLYGVLRQHFGRDFSLELSSPAEGINALCHLLPGFESFLRNAEARGLVFSVFAGPHNLSEQQLLFSSADNSVIRIVPLIVGSKSAGIFQTILGIALVAVGYFSFGTASPWGMGLIAAGSGAAVGGVMQMLSPIPGIGRGRDEEGNRASYAFGGAITTVAQGNPWPVLYGEREIGGAVLSGGIYAQDQV